MVKKTSKLHSSLLTTQSTLHHLSLLPSHTHIHTLMAAMQGSNLLIRSDTAHSTHHRSSHWEQSAALYCAQGYLEVQSGDLGIKPSTF